MNMESELVRWLAQQFNRDDSADVLIGDDAAVVAPRDGRLVLSTDSICDGVHFQSSSDTPESIGRKAIAVNLSDLAAMGAKPHAALVSLVLPRDSSLDYTKRILVGMKSIADRFAVQICGGDTAVWSGKLVINVSVTGHVHQEAWRLDRARAGDEIFVTGELGGSILGKHLSFEPRCDFAARWSDSKLIRAATDVSDSLSLDLQKMAAASRIGFEIEAESIPISAAARQLSQRPGEVLSALEHALYDGEDFELILAIDPAHVDELVAGHRSPPRLTRIGRFTAGTTYLLITDEISQTLLPKGYRHEFAGSADETPAHQGGGPGGS